MDESIVRTITAVVAVFTVVAATIQYGVTKRSEFRKRFWEEQLCIYRRVCAAAGSIATAHHIVDVENERKEFWKLYWGELSILEHANVKQAMEKFGIQLRNVEAGAATPETLELPSYNLARACRMSLGKTWHTVKLDDLPEEVS
jgi:hypothetical protein